MLFSFGNYWGNNVELSECKFRTGEETVIQLTQRGFGLTDSSKKMLLHHRFSKFVPFQNARMVTKTIRNFGYKNNEKALLGELFHRMERDPSITMCPHVLGIEILLQKACGQFSDLIYLPSNPITLESQRYFFAIQRTESGTLKLFAIQYNHDTSFDSDDEFIFLVPITHKDT